MKNRSLGATGITVSEIGLGTWPLANPVWGSQDREQAVQVIQQAVAAGCRFVDTAPGYSDGQNEALLGEALGPLRAQVSICTKFGHNAEGTSNFEPGALRPSLEASLRRLQTEWVDVCLLHNPPFELLNGAGVSLFEELEHLKADGKLRAYGVSLDSLEELEAVIENTRCGVVEVLFNVFHQGPLAAFRRAQARGIGLIVKVPLDSGWLSGKYRADSRFSGVRDRWSPKIKARRAALVEQFATLVPAGTSLSHAALQYVLAQPEVSTVIPGAKTVAQVQDNIAAGSARLPADVVCAIHAFWQRELKSDPLPW